MPAFDALLILSFGGPEAHQDVIPFLENVARGRNIPRQRLLAVAQHYYHFGGRSPINGQCRALIAALQPLLDIPIYWGNRHWHPFLEDTMRRMAQDGIRRALVFVTSAYSSYSGCRQYLDDIACARASVGPGAPDCQKLRHYYDHPGFIEPNAEHLRAALAQAPGAPVLFTAHSIPLDMARNSKYVQQVEETARLVAAAAGVSGYRLVYQSRSGSPQQPWLGPDILDALSQTRAAGASSAVVAPIGFTSDHMEVLYDLDYEAFRHSQAIGLRMVRAATAGAHPRFIRMVLDLIEERQSGRVGYTICRDGCCPRPLSPNPEACPPAS